MIRTATARQALLATLGMAVFSSLLLPFGGCKNETTSEMTDDGTEVIVEEEEHKLTGKDFPTWAVEEWIGEKPELKDKMVLVDFWATWCPPCRASIPGLNEISHMFADRMVVVGVTDESPEDVAQMTEPAIDYYVASDTRSRMASQLNVTGIPQAFLVSPEGKILWAGHPAMLESPSGHDKLEKFLDEYVAEGDPLDPNAPAEEPTEPAEQPAEEPMPTEEPAKEPTPEPMPTEEPKPAEEPAGEPKPTEEPKPAEEPAGEPKPTTDGPKPAKELDPDIAAIIDFTGKPAPKLNVQEWVGVENEPRLAGKMILVDTWATWCIPCLRAVPELNEWQKKYGDRLTIVGLTDDDADAVADLESPEIEYQIAIDPEFEFAKAFKSKIRPFIVIVDPEGIVRWQGVPLEPTQKLTEEKLVELLDKYVPKSEEDADLQ